MPDAFPSDPDVDRKLDEAMPLPKADLRSLSDAAYKRGWNDSEQYWMNKSIEASSSPLIHQKLHDVMRSVSHVAKAAFNQEQGYNFRGIDDVLGALGPALRDHGVIPVPELLEASYRDALTTRQKPVRETTVRVAYHFTATDGSSVTVIVPGESLDFSDKGSAKAMSVAYRIALIQLFALPTNEPTTDHDGQYVTREGRTGLSPFELEYGRRLLEIAEDRDRAAADVKALAEFWPAVLDVSAQDQPVREDGPTWHAATIERFAAAVEQVETADEGRALASLLDKLGALAWRHEGNPLHTLMRRRADFLAQRNKQAFDAAMTAIQEARSKEELTVLSHSIAATVEYHHITEEQGQQLHAVLHERAAKLPETAVTDTPEEPWTDRYLPRSGERWERFKSLAEAAATAPAILALLEGSPETDTPPAVLWGPDGLQRVRDAGNAACFRNRRISEDALAEIDAAIAEAARVAEVDWK